MKERAKQKEKSTVREYAEAFIIALVLAFIIRTIIIQPFEIPSGSMLPTLQIGDYILANKFIYYLRKPQRGDIIIFKYPKNEKQDFIKRVIGLPGEEIKVEQQQVYINGKPILEPYLRDREQSISVSPRATDFGPFNVPPDSFFVMGDNRENSLDSRVWGPVTRQKIRGKAFIVYWSVKQAPYVEMSLWKKFFFKLFTLKDRIRLERIGHLIR